MAVRIDAFGGAASENSIRRVDDPNAIRFVRDQRWLGVLGAEVRLGIGGLDLSYSPEVEAWSMGVLVAWPGVWTIF